MTILHPVSLPQRHPHAHSPILVYQDVSQQIDQQTVVTVVVFQVGGHQKIDVVQAKIIQCLGEVKKIIEDHLMIPSRLEYPKMVSLGLVVHLDENPHRILLSVVQRTVIANGTSMVVGQVQRRARVVTVIAPQPLAPPRAQRP